MGDDPIIAELEALLAMARGELEYQMRITDEYRMKVELLEGIILKAMEKDAK
jgi:hypothetical protein